MYTLYKLFIVKNLTINVFFFFFFFDTDVLK
jgi:hypothetical protein